MRIRAFIVSTLITITFVSAIILKRADFNGTWIIDAEKSSFNGLPTESNAAKMLKINQQSKSLKLERIFWSNSSSIEYYQFNGHPIDTVMETYAKKSFMKWLENGNEFTISSTYKVTPENMDPWEYTRTEAILKLDELDQIIQVNDGDAILAAQKLASQLGLAVGISSGANFLGAVQLQNMMGDRANVVTVFADSNKKYLSTDLVKEEPARENYLTPHIELLDYKPIKRLDVSML